MLMEILRSPVSCLKVGTARKADWAPHRPWQFNSSQTLVIKVVYLRRLGAGAAQRRLMRLVIESPGGKVGAEMPQVVGPGIGPAFC